MSRQALIDGIELAVANATTVVASATALIAGFIQQVRDAADDEEELEAVLTSIEAQTAALAAAVATGTAAAEEPAGEDTTVGTDTVAGDDEGGLGGEPAGDEA